MRDIKFRGIIVASKNFAFGDYSYTKGKAFISSENLSDNADTFYCDEIVLNTLGQYTGLNDKNGVEIYEGDVLTYYNGYSEKTYTHIVRWDEKLACFALFEDSNEWQKESDWIKINRLEVIGNIHENPELLKA